MCVGLVSQAWDIGDSTLVRVQRSCGIGYNILHCAVIVSQVNGLFWGCEWLDTDWWHSSGDYILKAD